MFTFIDYSRRPTKVFFLHLILSLTTLSSFLHAKKPNIVFVFSDDHATQALGAYGHPISKIAQTPHLDQIAKAGMRFDRCMVTNSICGPSRATILTGKYSHLNGFFVNEGTQFDSSQQTFPKLMRKSGYQTSIIGKWHLGSDPTGFDHWDILPGQGKYYNPDFKTKKGLRNYTGYCTEIVTDKALEWLEQRNKQKPFMLMVQHKAPHRNWDPDFKYLDLYDDVEFPEPDTLFDNYEGRGTAAKDQDMSIEISMELNNDLKVDGNSDKKSRYYKGNYNRLTPEQKLLWDKYYNKRNSKFKKLNPKGRELIRWKYQSYVKDYVRCIKSVDDSVGRLRTYLKKNNLLENTVFIYSSDQGFYLGEHGWFDKRFMYDESYRTPLLISWPGVTKPGQSTDKLVSNLDFAQTFLAISGTQAPSDMQGMSLVPLLKGSDSDLWRTHHYYHYYEYPGWHMVRRHEGVYDGQYKLLHYYDLNEWELLDTHKDPKEMMNQYQNPEYKNVVAAMSAKLNDLKSEYQVPAGIPEFRMKHVGNDPNRYLSKGRRKIEGLPPKK
ncbi:MAG: sulfatase [Planctomycetes bacterium]|nr:sulfatase [Planctomycetota bacterium]